MGFARNWTSPYIQHKSLMTARKHLADCNLLPATGYNSRCHYRSTLGITRVVNGSTSYKLPGWWVWSVMLALWEVMLNPNLSGMETKVIYYFEKPSWDLSVRQLKIWYENPWFYFFTFDVIFVGTVENEPHSLVFICLAAKNTVRINNINKSRSFVRWR